MIFRKPVQVAPQLAGVVLIASLWFGGLACGQERRALAPRTAAPASIKPLGRMPGSQQLRVALTLKLRNQDALETLLHDLYDPTSPKYRQFLSVEEFTEQFGPTEDEYRGVIQFAKSNSLKVTHTAANRLVLDVSGPVSAIEQAFGVTMQVYQHPTEPRTFYAPNAEPSVDVSLPIQGIEGLSNLERPHPADLRLASNPQYPTPNATGSSPYSTFLGSDIRAAYAPGVTLDGTGQTVGILEFSTYNLSDVQFYFSNVKQPLKVPVVNAALDDIDQCGKNCTGGTLESAMDIELVISMAPNLSAVIVYEGVYPVDILNQMAADNVAKQLSCSWVWADDAYFVDPIFQEFAAQGQNFFTASGDGGGATTHLCTNFTNCSPSPFPAEDPYVTTVGGTMLTTASPGGAWLSETAWPSSGGGISVHSFPIASYQVPLINPANQGSTTIRNYPDVSAIADSVYFCSSGDCMNSGGTSASAPVWAGFLALVNQQTGGSSIGFLNPSIYALAQGSNYANDFHDITTGNNFNPASPNAYSAVAGYDLVTGLGSPNGQNLINALAPAATGPNFTLSSPPDTLTTTPGGPVTTTITVTGTSGFSGTVSLRATFLGQLTGITASFNPPTISGSGTSTLTISASNVLLHTNIPVVVTGTSGTFSHTTYLNLTVLMPSLVETAVTAPPASVNAGDTFSVTDTTQNIGQTSAGNSVTGYYLSATKTKTVSSHLLGTRSVPSLAVNATSTGTATVTVPSGLWPNTPYYLLACADDSGAIVELSVNGCAASTAKVLLNSPALPATTTTLAVTSGGSAVTTITHGTAVTLTATVTAGSAPVTPGLVNFCDAAAPACADIHLLGTAQLTSNGTASLKFIPGNGNHSYKAVFVGTVAAAGSSSNPSALTVTGTYPSATTISYGGNPGNYTVVATVTGNGLAPATGQISFQDTTSGNSVLGTATLAPSVPTLNWNSQTMATGMLPYSVVAADLNGDGIPDLAIADNNECAVMVLIGNGDGTFAAPSKTNVTCYPEHVAVGDFNGDGKADLVVTSEPLESSTGQFLLGITTILLGKGDGTFTPMATQYTMGVEPTSIAVADFNGDGIADLAIGPFLPTGVTYPLMILLGNGDGTFTAAAPIELPALPYSIAVGDFNGDGKTDMAVASGGVTVLLGNGDGTFTVGSTPTIQVSPTCVQAGDFNGDGKLDLAAMGYPTSASFPSGRLAILTGNGDGTFTPSSTVTIPYATFIANYSMAAGDFDGVGKLDLAVANDGVNNVAIIMGNGDGTFVESTTLPMNISPRDLTAADFAGNGKAGLAVVNSNSTTILLPQFTANATATVSPSGTGTHLVDASYPGDTNYTSSVSPTTSLTASPISFSPGSLTFSPQFVGTSSASQAVTVKNAGSAAINISSIAASANFAQTNNCASSVAASGSCTINVTFTPTSSGPLTGALTITDDANGAGSMQTVALNGTGQDFTLGAASGFPTSVTVAPGQTATYSLSLAAQGGLSGNVSFAVTGAPSLTTCTVSPNPAALGANVTITCATTRGSAMLPSHRLGPRLPPPQPSWYALSTLLALLVVVALWAMTRRRRHGAYASRPTLAALGAALLLMLALLGCGGGGGGAGGGGGGSTPGTPAGTYALTVTATVGSGSPSLSHNITLTMTVTAP